MLHLHVHIGGSTAPQSSTQAIGDGSILKGLAALLALLLQYGIIKLPVPAATDGQVSGTP